MTGRISVNESVLAWALMLPFVFFAVHGVFSFQDDGTGAGFTGIVPSRHLGTLGYVAIPGIAYIVVAYVLAVNIGRVARMTLEMKMLSLLALLTVFSVFWSQDPVRSAFNGAFYLTGTLFAYYLVSCFGARDIMRLVMMAGTLVCLAGLVVVVLFPRFGVETVDPRTFGAWKGLFVGRTAAAKCLVFLLSPALVAGHTQRSFRWIAYVLLVGVSILSAKAVTALLIVFLYMLLMGAFNLARRLERKTALIIGVTVSLNCLIVAAASLSYLPSVLRFLGRDPTLTGRTVVWSALAPSILKHPILGYGFYAFWLGLRGESANVIIGVHWFFGYAHNGMLEILLQLGLVGLLVFLVTFVQAIRDAWFCIRYGRSVGVEWYAGILFLTVLYNIDEATVLLPNELLSILYVVACCGLSVEARRIRAFAPRRHAADGQLPIAVEPSL
jgi:O-antigen ligase